MSTLSNQLHGREAKSTSHGTWRQSIRAVWRHVVACCTPLPGFCEQYQPPSTSRMAWWGMLIGLWGLQALLLYSTWGAWPDLVIDFGRELYIPWQMGEGQVLYRDLAYFNGPLSPLVNASLFALFGADFRVLAAANAIVLAGVVGLLYFNLTRLFSAATSASAVAVFLLLFAFGHTYGIGNFNFLSPYSHEMTHGFALCLLLLTILTSWHSSTARGAGAGICVGLVALTKPELGVAAVTLVTASLGLRYVWIGESRRNALAECSAFALAVSFAVVAVVGLLAWHQGGWSRAWNDSLGAWKWVVTSRVSGMSFYRSISGLDTPALHLARAASGVAGFILLLIATRNHEGLSERQQLAKRLAGIAGFAALIAFSPFVLKNMQVGALVLLTLLFLVPRRWQREHSATWQHVVCWTTLGLVLLLKMFLYPRVDGYGFVLAALGVTLGIAVAIEWLPRLFYSGSMRIAVQTAVVMLIVLDVVRLGGISQIRLASKSYTLSTGGQGLRSYPCIGPIVQQASDYIETHVAPDESMLVLPEGVMLNYLTQRRSPTRYYTFMPPELEMFGADEILSDLVESRPDVVVLVRRVVFEYGHDRFGGDGYGEAILDWVQANYRVEATFGADPLGEGDFGIAVLRPASF